LPPVSVEGAKNPRRGALDREVEGGDSGNTVKEDRTSGEDGPENRFFGFGLAKEYRMGCAFSERKGRTGSE